MMMTDDYEIMDMKLINDDDDDREIMDTKLMIYKAMMN
jgi:hypothetical protein